MGSGGNGDLYHIMRENIILYMRQLEPAASRFELKKEVMKLAVQWRVLGEIKLLLENN